MRILHLLILNMGIRTELFGLLTLTSGFCYYQYNTNPLLLLGLLPVATAIGITSALGTGYTVEMGYKLLKRDINQVNILIACDMTLEVVSIVSYFLLARHFS